MDALLGPLEGETGVEDAARVEGRLGAVDHRQRRDRCEAGRVRGGGEELADAAVGDAHHPDLAVRHPGLPRDRLDDVVAVERLERLEEVEGSAGAAGAPHVDVDDREAHQVRQDRDPALRSVGIRVAVSGVLDQGRGRSAGRERRQVESGQDAGDVRGWVDVDRELRAVASPQIAVPARRDVLVVDPGARRRRPRREHADRSRGPAVRREPVPGARLDGAVDDAAELARALAVDDVAVPAQELRPRPRLETRRVDLLGAPVRVERRALGAVGRRRQQRER